MTKRLIHFVLALVGLLSLSGAAHAANPAGLSCGGATNTCLATGKIDGTASFELTVPVSVTCTALTFNYVPIAKQQTKVPAYDCTKAAKYVCKPHSPIASVDLKQGHLTAICKVSADNEVTLSTPKPKAAAPSGQERAPLAPAAAPGPSFLALDGWVGVLDALHLPIAGKKLGQYYNRAADTAVLFFDADGTPYFPLLDTIDEDDDIFVAIVDTQERLTGLEVALTGCNRTPAEPRVYSNITATLGSLAAGGEEAPLVPPPPAQLGMILRSVGKCEGADTGGPQLSVRSPATNLTHTMTIPVNKLYRFAVGVGLGLDTTMQREFSLQTAPGDTVARISETNDIHGVSTLIYISFYPSARDFRKTDKDSVGQRFQIFAGLDPANFSKSVTIGTGVELVQGFNLLLGWRVLSKQTILAEGSGLKSGSSFDGTRDSLPTRERWEVGLPYLGFGLSSDLLTRIK